MDASRATTFVNDVWDSSILPALQDYIRIPNRSPMFDPKWVENGHMARAVSLVEQWCRAQPIEGLTVEIVQLEGRTPLIYMEVPGTVADTVLLYGHLDKQPEMTGWAEGLEPWRPVMRDDKLFGRGGADDGYSAFASLTAIRTLKEQGVAHARFVIVIEACEESGSYDLPAYIDHLAPRIGTPSLIVCLDSGCGNYDQLWCTTSLRGLVAGDLSIEILKEGVHSGDASGVVPSSFRILRQILSRLEDEKTGKVKLAEFHVPVPAARRAQARAVARVLGKQVHAHFPFVKGAKPMGTNGAELLLNRTWRPTLSVTGAEGLPPLASAGNVLRPGTSIRLSMRLPPSANADRAVKALKRAIERQPPYGARVTFTRETRSPGWDAPPFAPWLEQSMTAASKRYFGRPAAMMGEGGSIPFMGMLGKRFPKAQFLITGVLGPGSNAHGPNEFLHVPTGKKLTCCVAEVLEGHARRG